MSQASFGTSCIRFFLLRLSSVGFVYIFASFFKQSDVPLKVSETATVTGRLSGKSARPHQRIGNASTRVGNLSQSDKTDVANARFNMDTKLGACQSPRVLSALARVTGFAGVPRFRIFRARGGDEFLRMCSRWATITFGGVES